MFLAIYKKSRYISVSAFMCLELIPVKTGIVFLKRLMHCSTYQIQQDECSYVDE